MSKRLFTARRKTNILIIKNGINCLVFLLNVKYVLSFYTSLSWLVLFPVSFKHKHRASVDRLIGCWFPVPDTPDELKQPIRRQCAPSRPKSASPARGFEKAPRGLVEQSETLRGCVRIAHTTRTKQYVKTVRHYNLILFKDTI